MARRTLDLGRDLLDVQLVDREQRLIGRVDGVLLELRDGAPPRVAAMEVGLLTAVRRIHPTLAALLRRLVRRLPVRPATCRLPLSLFRDVGVDIELDLDASRDRRLLRVERWLSRRIVQRLPQFKDASR
jgi:hypothetical protein